MLLGKTKKMRLSALFLTAAIGLASVMPSDALAKDAIPKRGQSTPKSMLVINAQSGEVFIATTQKKNGLQHH